MKIIEELEKLGVEITDAIKSKFDGDFVSREEMDKKVKKAEVERDNWKTRDAVIIAFIANEVISITENAGLMGIPIPSVIIKAIDVLKNDDKKGKGDTDE